MTQQPNPWLLRHGNAPRRFRLFCFHHAGGNAGHYRDWQAGLELRLGGGVEVCAVQLPGRAQRSAETPYASLPALVKALAPVITQHSHLPFAFFGHGMGGLLAYELTRYCQLHALPLPQILLVSGLAAPQYRSAPRAWHKLDDETLRQTLLQADAMPPEALASEAAMQAILPVLRADFAMVETWQFFPAPALHIPVTVLAGRRDRRTTPEQVDGWSRETATYCRIEWLDGEHFFIHQQISAVLDCIAASLRHCQGMQLAVA
ncbi:alpha/beta fold hydrolase [Massilia sp. W12]|uniref:thioesterase II family protein n=1 Tax=Massilia sp. W12 TaxID=3126507 RepID=UPI0030D0F850